MVSYQGSQGYLDCCSKVLILVVVEDGLVQHYNYERYKQRSVLILVVVEDGLVHKETGEFVEGITSLNPCCSGRWSRTRPYKTILIINKLKNSTKQFFTFLNRKLTFS